MTPTNRTALNLPAINANMSGLFIFPAMALSLLDTFGLIDTTMPATLLAWAFVVAPCVQLLLRNSFTSAITATGSHIVERRPNARGEIVLFLSAGLLAAGVKACIAQGLIELPLGQTDATVASLVLVCIVGGAYLGIHPFALVAIFLGLIADITTTPTLMAIAYIMALHCRCQAAFSAA